MAWCTAIVVYILAMLQLREWVVSTSGMPNDLTTESDSIQKGEKPSGLFAWDILVNITALPHQYNSIQNMKVRSTLTNHVKKVTSDYNTWGCSNNNPVEILDDEVNLTRREKYAYYNFQSDNLLVLVKGKKTDTLLVSAHFDSASQSHGVTDDGIGIASMMTAFQALTRKSCANQLEYSVLFNFNNAEEIGLLGGYAFTLHPYFKNVKGFINLEGTGVSRSTRSALFRTNNFEITKQIFGESQFPHSSFIANQLMSLIESDTDFRPYSLLGDVPGIDVAFYKDRYLYHTPLDNIEHTSKRSVQFMVDNLYAGINTMMKSNFLQESKPVRPSSIPLNSTLSVPDFLFYDRLGVIAYVQSKTTFLTFTLVLMIVGTVFTLVNLGVVRYFNGIRTTYKGYIVPASYGFFVVLVCLFVTLIANFAISFIRTKLNPGFTYGYPELSLASIASLILTVMCIVVYFLVSKKADFIALKEGSSIDSLESGVANEELIFSFEDALQPGLLLFWFFGTILSYTTASLGAPVLYLFNEWALYGLIAHIVATGIQYLVPTYPHLNRKSFIDTGVFIVQWIISAFWPFLLTLDLLTLLLTFFPSTINSEFPDYIIDVAFSVLAFVCLATFLPLIAKSNVIISGTFFGVVFLGCTIPQFFLFPFSTERPANVGYLEKWNITDQESSKTSQKTFYLQSSMSPNSWFNKLQQHGWGFPNNVTITANRVRFDTVEVPQILNQSFENIITLEVAKSVENNLTVFKGTILAGANSRVFRVNTTVTGTGTVIFDGPTYQNPSTQKIESKELMNNGITYFLARNFTRPDQRLFYEFQISMTSTSKVTLDLSSLYDVTYSPYYSKYVQQKPDWTIQGTALDLNELIVTKSVQFNP
ncbi:hypothetical protein BC833DRAFT_605506 [Globomyces pollinis-pini]|nr:hypothetical protein BC833DRAFT_605506 [Globomyces pollinis-pini]